MAGLTAAGGVRAWLSRALFVAGYCVAWTAVGTGGYELAVESGSLAARHWRNPPATLSPTAEDVFSGDQWWFPEVRFTRDREGRVEGFAVTGSRVRDLIFERVR